MSIIYIFFVLTCFTELSAINVGLEKEVFYCQTIKVGPKVSDGKMDTFELLDKSCATGFMLIMQLDGHYSIHYVVAHMAASSWSGVALEYLNVENIYKDNFHYCGSYPKAAWSLMTKKGMRVNCLSWLIFFSAISLSTFYMGPMNITEIEVHTLSSTNKIRDRAIIHRGCFKSIVTIEESKEILTCPRFCAAKGFAVAALKGPSETCHCAVDFDENNEVSTDDCTSKCGKPEMACGGPKLYSVYLVNIQLPYFDGCRLERNEKPKNSLTKPDLTIEMCIKRCNDHGYVEFKGGNNCWCTDVPPNVRVSPIHCDRPCGGNPLQMCGSSETYVSLYGTCIRDVTFKIKCSKLFHCSQSWDEYGACQSGCQSGFKGEYCMERAYYKMVKAGSFQNTLDSITKENLLALALLFLLLGIILLAWNILKKTENTSETSSSTSSGSSASGD